jgi:hypothetical protein
MYRLDVDEMIVLKSLERNDFKFLSNKVWERQKKKLKGPTT